MSGTVCCYAGCKKSYSKDKDTSFFTFPEDPKRRKKWMQNCGNLELESLSDRQLRGKRICSDHFTSKSFSRSNTTLHDSAIPIVAKTKVGGNAPTSTASPAASAQKPKAGGVTTPTTKSKPVAVTTPTTKLKPVAVTTPTTKSKPAAVITATKSKPAAITTATKSKPAAITTATKSKPAAVTTATKSKPGGNVALSNPAVSPTTKNTEVIQPRRGGRGRSSGKTEIDDVESEEVGKNDRKEGSPSPRPTKKRKLDTTVVSPEEKPEIKSKPNVSTTDESKITQVNSSGTTNETPVKKKKNKNKGQQSVPVTDSPGGSDPPLQQYGKKGTPIAGSSAKLSHDEAAKIIANQVSKMQDIVLVPTGSGKKTVPSTSKSTGPTLQKVDHGDIVSEALRNPVASPTTKNTEVFHPRRGGRGRSSAKTETDDVVSEEVGVSGKNVKKESSTSPLPTKKRKLDTTVVSPEEKPGNKSKSNVAKTDQSKIAQVNSSGTTNETPVKKKKNKNKGQQSIPVTDSPSKINIVSVRGGVPPLQQYGKKGTPIAGSSVKLSHDEAAKIIANQVSKMQDIILLPTGSGKKTVPSTPKPAGPILQKVDHEDVVSEADSYDEYMYYDRDFEEMETGFQDETEAKADREFERFYANLRKFLRLSGKWSMGGVQWDPQGKRKVIIISEPEIPPNGKVCVKRCLQFFEDKAIRVFIDGMDMTDVFGMTCYAEKEDVAALVCRVAEASSCCGVPEMVADDLVHFPAAKKRNTSYFDSECPGVIPNDSYDPICSSCKILQEQVHESRRKEQERLLERRIRSQEKQFLHPFGEALYTMFDDLVDETDPTKPKKKRTKETFFRKYLHDTRYKMEGDSAKTERVYIEKPISVDSVSASFQDIVSKLGFNTPNLKRKSFVSSVPRPSFSTPKPNRVMASSSNMARKLPLHVDHLLPFSAGSSFTLDDGQEYELIGEVDPMSVGSEIVEMKHTPSQQYEIIEVDDETLAKLASSKNSVVVLPETASSFSTPQVTRIDANDPNLSQILKAINTSQGYKLN